MADDRDDAIARVVAKRIEMLHDAPLQLPHALAVGRTARASSAVPAPPCRIVIQFTEQASGPVAEIDFVDLRDDLHRQTKACGNDAGRLLRAALRTRLNGC